jgi:hypothetical protein
MFIQEPLSMYSTFQRAGSEDGTLFRQSVELPADEREENFFYEISFSVVYNIGNLKPPAF